MNSDAESLRRSTSASVRRWRLPGSCSAPVSGASGHPSRKRTRTLQDHLRRTQSSSSELPQAGKVFQAVLFLLSHPWGRRVPSPSVPDQTSNLQKPRASFVSPSYPPRRPLIFSWPAGASQLSPALPLAPVRASLELHPKLGSPVANPKPAKTPSSTRARRFPVPGPGTLPSKRKWVENSTQGFSGTASPWDDDGWRWTMLPPSRCLSPTDRCQILQLQARGSACAEVGAQSVREQAHSAPIVL